ncbi:signal recognition particle-docking protein FtsY [Oscillatoria amoena NRMC-F 0135]|nr:signal recognition particle-docking protein FtsY [Oscillatoria laete-virens]MDL5049111.1 signal recognition particle-docking protein FtsY [Oscillatoria amoena NRMC-F 0135]MDL5054005.1 signal recognition particle-docking protein FtsY [Oscillatoria laete-virens NRMC-F 0139]
MLGFIDKLKTGLQKARVGIARAFSGEKLDFDSLEEALLQADFGLPMTEKAMKAVRERASVTLKVDDLREVAVMEILSLYGGQDDYPLSRVSSGTTVVLVVGVNGTGKTTTCAKLGALLKNQGQNPALVAADTFRAAAVEQLQSWGGRLGLPVVTGKPGADPASVAFDGVSTGMAQGHDIILIDTAGRLHNKANLMAELEKIRRVIGKKCADAPHETLLVVDGSTGSNALNQAREFHKITPLTGLVVTKLDGTGKGGIVVAIQQELGIPVKFIGLGEQAEDLQPFRPEEFIRSLFEK